VPIVLKSGSLTLRELSGLQWDFYTFTALPALKAHRYPVPVTRLHPNSRDYMLLFLVLTMMRLRISGVLETRIFSKERLNYVQDLISEFCFSQ
jgi:hypothetical protein